MNDLTKVLTDALARDYEARATFAWMTCKHRAAFSGWIQSAASEPERAKRVREAVDMPAGRDPVRRN
jgi:Bacteriocin-protection, YdeI or OmpD-Associated